MVVCAWNSTRILGCVWAGVGWRATSGQWRRRGPLPRDAADECVCVCVRAHTHTHTDHVVGVVPVVLERQPGPLPLPLLPVLPPPVPRSRPPPSPLYAETVSPFRDRSRPLAPRACIEGPLQVLRYRSRPLAPRRRRFCAQATRRADVIDSKGLNCELSIASRVRISSWSRRRPVGPASPVGRQLAPVLATARRLGYWSNQLPAYWSNQSPVCWSNQSPAYWSNQSPAYWSNQSPAYWSNQSPGALQLAARHCS